MHLPLGSFVVYTVLLHFMICHSNIKCHRPRTSSCHKRWNRIRVLLVKVGLGDSTRIWLVANARAVAGM